MENRKQQSGGSSFAETLFGPKDCGSYSSGIFGSVFGPSSTGLGKESIHSKYTGSAKKEEFGSPKHSEDSKTQRSINGAKEKNPIYQTETAEPSYLSSSIYYGGQEVYPPTSNTTFYQHSRAFKKGRGDEDLSGSSASRGNWWQGSLYY